MCRDTAIAEFWAEYAGEGDLFGLKDKLFRDSDGMRYDKEGHGDRDTFTMLRRRAPGGSECR